MKPEKIKPVRVDVTDKDIALGKRMEVGCCMVALAAQRAFGIEQCVNGYVSVSQSEMLVVRYDPADPYNATMQARAEWVLPQNVSATIKAWDDGGDVKPFSFDLEHEAKEFSSWLSANFE